MNVVRLTLLRRGEKTNPAWWRQNNWLAPKLKLQSAALARGLDWLIPQPFVASHPNVMARGRGFGFLELEAHSPLVVQSKGTPRTTIREWRQ